MRLVLLVLLQDKDQVLSDIRSIIAEQLGTDLDKVRYTITCRSTNVLSWYSPMRMRPKCQPSSVFCSQLPPGGLR